jgi:hypothetical protein
VAGHGTGVTETEVDVLVAVDVGEAGAGGPVDVHREAAGGLVHPGHRHAAEKVTGAGVRGGRARVPVGEGGALPIGQDAEMIAVDEVARHGATVPRRDQNKAS